MRRRGTGLAGAVPLAKAAGDLREFAAFMEDGGYRRPEFWLSAGWARCRTTAGARRSTGPAKRRLERVYPARGAAAGPHEDGAGEPRELL
jgi:formylglycine-generating enzyme required for sulfatase activity